MRAPRIQFENVSDVEGACVDHGVMEVVDQNGCTCAFFKTMMLPCAHIIAFLIFNEEDPFKPTLCAERWTRQHAQFMSGSAYKVPSASQFKFIQTPNAPRRRRHMESNEMFREAETETKKICEVLAEKTQAEYDEWLLQLKQFRKRLEDNDMPNLRIQLALPSNGNFYQFHLKTFSTD